MNRSRPDASPPHPSPGVRLYRALLRAYPTRFRGRWGDGMVRAFAVRLDRAQRLGGRRGRWRALASGLADLLVTAFLERFSPALRAPLPGLDSPRPRSRHEGELMPMRLLWQLRTAARTIARQPLFSAIIVLTLTLGAGGTVAFFGLLDAAVLRPLPYADADRLVSLTQRSERMGLYAWAAPFLDEIRTGTRSYESLAGFSPTWALTATDPGEPFIVRGAFVTDGALEMFGARPVTGRLFTADEQLPGAPPVVTVSEDLWQRLYGGAPLRGQTITLDGTAYAIVGILDSDLRLPITSSTVSTNNNRSELWLPFSNNPFFRVPQVPIMNLVGRLAPGSTVESANAELDTVRASLAADHPDAGISDRALVMPLDDMVTGDARGIAWVLFGAATFLLVIACANVANLLLARSTARTEEMAIRASLGASRGRLLTQMLTESGMLAVLGSLGGLVVAVWLLRVLPGMGFLAMPPSSTVRMDARLVFFSFAVTLATTLLFGLVPALQATRRRATVPGTGTRVADAGAQRIRSGLVAAEVALALVLLVGAGLLGRSFLALTAVDVGFRSEGVVGVPIGLGNARWGQSADRRQFFSDLSDRLATLPGVDRVAAVNRTPLGGGNVFVGVEFEAGNARSEDALNMDRRVVTPGYFETLAVPLLEGRDFTPLDAASAAEPVAIVNRAAVPLFVGDPVGQLVRLQLRGGPGPWLRVVGVVGDIQHHGLAAAVEPEIYVPYEQAAVSSMVVLLRTSRDVEELRSAVSGIVWGIDDEIPLDGIAELSTVVEEAVADPRTRMLLMQSFAALALALAGIGIAGVVSYSVARRTRDFGIRMALGARPPEVLKLALREGLVPGVLGAVVGLAVAVGLSRFVATLLYGTSPTDPLTFAGVTLALLAIITFASWVPARRATQVDPVIVLKES